MKRTIIYILFSGTVGLFGFNPIKILLQLEGGRAQSKKHEFSLKIFSII
jgi:hypothetical protein